MKLEWHRKWRASYYRLCGKWHTIDQIEPESAPLQTIDMIYLKWYFIFVIAVVYGWPGQVVVCNLHFAVSEIVSDAFTCEYSLQIERRPHMINSPTTNRYSLAHSNE